MAEDYHLRCLPPPEAECAADYCRRGLELLRDGDSSRNDQRAALAFFDMAVCTLATTCCAKFLLIAFCEQAAMGSADGLALVARMYGAGWGIKENGPLAFALATKALAHNSAWAHFVLG